MGIFDLGLQRFTIVNDCGTVRVAITTEGDEKGVGRCGARPGRVPWLRVQEQRGARTDENRDVAERGVEDYRAFA
jgi:hypothetical protein